MGDFKIVKVHISKKEWRKDPDQAWYFAILRKTRFFGWKFINTRDIDLGGDRIHPLRYLCSTEAEAEEVVKNLQYEKII
jgi:hypothetical protein